MKTTLLLKMIRKNTYTIRFSVRNLDVFHFEKKNSSFIGERFEYSILMNGGQMVKLLCNGIFKSFT